MFWTFCVFMHLIPYSPHKFITNRFAIVRPIHPYAGLPVTPCASKVMLKLHITHHTSPCCFGGLTFCTVIFCLCWKNVCASLSPPKWLVPIVGIVATNNKCICQNYHFGCGNALLMSLPANSCGVLLPLKKTLSVTLRLFCFARWKQWLQDCFFPQETCSWSTRLVPWWGGCLDD